MKTEDINSKIKEGRIHLKLFQGAKSKQLNHYVKPTFDESMIVKWFMWASIIDILQWKHECELENLPTNIIETGKTF